MPSQPAKPRAKGRTPPVTSVRNALRILQAFSFEHPVVGVSDLARQLRLPKSTVSRLIQTLAGEGFVDSVDGGYRLALKLHELGSLVISGVELREIAHAKLVALRNLSGETVHLAVLDGHQVVYLDRIESPNTMHTFTRLGRRMPAYSTSSGKAILAFAPTTLFDAVIAAGLTPYTSRTIATREALAAALDTTRASGIAVSIEESEPGINSVAAPIFDYSGNVIAAISVAGPTDRMTAATIARISQHLKTATAGVSHEMGYRSTRRPAGPKTRAAAFGDGAISA
jgi:DNA-binding IclR family transcriptional regulator